MQITTVPRQQGSSHCVNSTGDNKDVPHANINLYACQVT
jgi:hypothetical protein